MKSTFVISDETYTRDINQLWRAIKRMRSDDLYQNLKVTLQNWATNCDGITDRSGIAQGFDVTDVFRLVPNPPTTEELLFLMDKAGIDVNIATELPVRLTYSVDIEHDDLTA